MSNAEDMTRQLLRGSDPVPVEMTTGTASDPIGRATLTRILAVPRNQTGPGLRPRRGWRLAAIVATGAAALLAVPSPMPIAVQVRPARRKVLISAASSDFDTTASATKSFSFCASRRTI